MDLYISIDLGFLTKISIFINFTKKVKSKKKLTKNFFFNKKVLGEIQKHEV